MPVITIHAPAHCGGREVARRVAERLSCSLLDDEDLLGRVARRQGLSLARIRRAFFGDDRLLAVVTGERERSVARYEEEVARAILDGDVVLFGRAGFFVPSALTQVIRVSLDADMASRVERVRRLRPGIARRVRRSLQSADDEERQWLELVLHGELRAWKHDVVIRMDEAGIEGAVELIAEHAMSRGSGATAASEQAARDFELAARVRSTLLEEGHAVEVEASGGAVTLTPRRRVLMMNRLTAELLRLAEDVKGVQSVQVRTFDGASSYGRDEIERLVGVKGGRVV